ncbi:MAG: HlyD family efflux transporter periplasmic adaptor subunit [Bacteroidales bacterium]|jgi:HlyD family secretion protein|nr:HlyD family efflux transporter periplasmic adaptor subunit [Bacteroidales bacterium]
MKHFPIFLIVVLLLASCNQYDQPDGYGIFHNLEWTISADADGKVTDLKAEEGTLLSRGEVVGHIDTTLLMLQRNNLISQIAALRATMPKEAIQIEAYTSEKDALVKELERVRNLVASGSLDSKKLEQTEDKISILESRIEAARAQLKQQSASVLAQIEVLASQKHLIDEQIRRCTIYSPEDGIVVTRYLNEHEYVLIGRPIFKLARTDKMLFKCWLDGATLTKVKLGDNVTVITDGPDGTLVEHQGTVSYISEHSEYAPNHIQTRDNRTRLVYMVKIEVPNDGTLRAGLPAELHL